MIKPIATALLLVLLVWAGQTAAQNQDQTLYVNEWVAVWEGKRLTWIRFLEDGVACLQQKALNPTQGRWLEVGPDGSPLQVKSDTCTSVTLGIYLQQADRRFGNEISLTLPGNHGFVVFEAVDPTTALAWCRSYAAALARIQSGQEDGTHQDPPACLLAPAAG